MYKLFAPHYIVGINGACFEGASKTLKQMSGAQALKVIKSWTNGWATSHRMHEDHALDCVLGWVQRQLVSLLALPTHVRFSEIHFW